MNTFNKIPATLKNIAFWCMGVEDKEEYESFRKKRFYDDLSDKVYWCNVFRFKLVMSLENIDFGDVDCDVITNTMGALLLSEFETKTYFRFIEKLVFQHNYPCEIPISIHFYQFLWHNGYIARLLKIGNLHDMRQFLLLGGDIEANPGPVDYKVTCSISYHKNKIAKDKHRRKLELAYEKAMRTYTKEDDVPCEIKDVKGEIQMLKTAIFGATAGTIAYNAHKVSNRMNSSIESISESITQTLTDFRNMFSNVQDYIVGKIDTISLIGDIIFSILHIYMSQPRYKYYSLSIEVCRMLLKYGISSEQISDFKNYILDITDISDPSVKDISGHMQMDLETFKNVELNPTHIVVFLIGILSLVFTQQLPKPTFTEATLKRLGDLGRSAKGIKDLGGVTHEAITIALNKFRTEILGLNPREDIEKFISGMDEWFDQVRTFLERHDEFKKSDEILRKPETILEVESLYKRGLEYAKDISDKKLNQSLSMPFNIHMKYLTDLLKQVDTSGAFGTRPRTQPVVIWLYGESGVGKSGMSWPLAVDLNNLFVPNKTEAREFSKNIYMRNVEQEFWDNYQGQNVVIYDDFGQRKDGAANPNEEFMELIRTANIAPYPLHMAHLEDKRKTRFTSKIVMLTSNVFNHVVNSLTFPDAFRRRVDLCARVYNKDEYTKAGYSMTGGQAVQRLDKEKVQKLTGKIISTDVYLLDLIDPESGSTLAEGLTYSEFLDIAIEKTHKAFNSSIKMNEFLEEYAESRFRDIPAKAQGQRENLVKINGKDIIKIVTENPPIYNAKGEEFEPSEVVAEQVLNYDGEEDFTSFMDKVYNFIVSNYFIKINPLSQKLANLKNAAMRYLKDWANSTIDFIKRHPFGILSSLLLVLSGIFVMTGVYSKCFGNNEKKIEQVEVANCNRVRVKLFDSSKQYNDISDLKTHHIIQFLPKILENPYPLLVNKIDTNLLNCLNSLEVETEIYVKEPIVNFRGRRFQLEASVSGDPKTLKPAVIKTEAVVSSDPTTIKPKTLSVEAMVSGDPITAKPHHVKVEAVVSGDPTTLKPVNIRTESLQQQPQKLTENDIVGNMQMWKDQVAQNLITNRVLTNLYKICLKRDTGMYPVLHGLFVRGTNMLVPGHFLAGVRETDTICIANIFDVVFEVPFKDLIITPIVNSVGDNKEAILITFPKYVHQHTDLVKHFSDSESMTIYKTAETCLPTLRFSDKQKKFMLTILGNQTARALDFVARITDEQYGKFLIRQGLTYKCPTKVGDCGAPLIINESKVLRKIAGIHVAGDDDGNAYSESITQKDLERAFVDIPAHMQIQTDFDSSISTIVDIPLEMNIEQDIAENYGLPSQRFTPLGRVQPLFEPNKTELQPSLIYGQVDSIKTKPAILTHPTINIKHKNLAKSALNTPYIDPNIIDRAYIFTKAKWFQGKRDELARLLTWDECIQGSTDSEYIGPINRQSSPGYPWILQRQNGFKGKTQWFGDDQTYFFDEEVQQACIFREEMARKGIRVPTIWVDTLKDERRPIAKVDALKTRVFSNGPMDYTILFRKYFLGFVAHLMENRIENEVSIGTNVYSQDWGKTARKLLRKGRKVIAGDFSTFDGTLNSCMMEKFVQLVNDFYDDGPQNALVRQVLFLDVFNSVHLCDGLIYMTTHSQPSGNPVTTPLNCFINSMGLRMCFEECMRGTKYSMRDFDEHVSMVSFGDDNVINFSDEVADRFNMTTITSAFAKFGYVYTDEAKTLSGEIPKWRDISEVAYLKRQFIYDEKKRVWNAPLDLGVILETPCWMRGTLDAETGTKVNCEVSIMELSLHPKPVFDKWSKVISDAYLRATGQTLETDSYDGYWTTRYNDYYI